jgi:dihydroxyacetone kinase
LETWWTAPADTPAFRKGALEPVRGDDVAEDLGDLEVTAVPVGSDESRAAARLVQAALEAVREAVAANEAELGRIDAVAGDGDHGIGMARGSAAAADAGRSALDQGAGAGTVLVHAADAWADKAGGTSGALWGAALQALGTALGDVRRPEAETVSAGVTAAADAVMRLGKAQVGDKTMVDALRPFSDVLAEGVRTGQDLAEAWGSAAEAASTAAEQTANLLPRMGRARPHAERSLGTPDAGAVSLALIVRTVHDVLAQHPRPASAREGSAT